MSDNKTVLLSARVKTTTKKRLEQYCAGEIDGMKHIQEDVVEYSINKQIDRAEEIELMTKNPKKKAGK